MNIPFHKPQYGIGDEHALVAALRSGRLVGDAENTRRASSMLADMLGVRHVLLTTSCSHALELAMMVLRLRSDDEVIIPSFTFVSTANCILRSRGRLVFADILPDTLTLDLRDVERRITPRTRAIIPVVYAGVSPEMDTLMALARRHSITVVEDAAQGIAARYKERATGTTGDIGCFSFHETKNYSTGEGGAFVTNDDALMSAAEIIREKGTNRKQFMQGLVDKYTWVDVGSSYLPPDLMPALLMSQLSQRETVQARRRAIYQRYMEAFAPLAEQGRLQLPVIPHGVDSNHHIYHVLLQNEQTRNKALAFFRDRGIGTTFHYLPLHLSPVGQSLGFRPGECPVTEDVSDRLLRLPIYPALTPDEQEYVIRSMMEFLHQ
jgi:dTDP-4-amino-4,6-dideoxygalactose transaminase